MGLFFILVLLLPSSLSAQAVSLEFASPLKPDQQSVVMEPGPVPLSIRAPGAAWLCYQPDAGEVRRYFLGTPADDSTFRWPLETVTGGKLYVSSGDAVSPALRVESGAYDALERALSPDPRVRIEVNLPAFELSLYRENQLLRRFKVGIGVKDWPVPPGLRVAREIVWNPDWTPPDSPWATPALVRKLRRRGEVLGRVKIPLGGEILIHGTNRPTDRGRLVSHGCIRMLNRDIRELAALLVQETAAPAAAEKVRRAQRDPKFSYGVALARPIVVAIRYQPVMVRAGRVTVYRDVYGWQPVRREQILEARKYAGPAEDRRPRLKKAMYHR